MANKAQVLVDHISKYIKTITFAEWIIVNIQKVDLCPIWIIATAREEGTLTALNYEVEVYLNQKN